MSGGGMSSGSRIHREVVLAVYSVRIRVNESANLEGWKWRSVGVVNQNKIGVP
jgi:hypothetical protein